ncbi:MAG: DUF2141 domain-containing protein [Salibacteraceae bacterium]
MRTILFLQFLALSISLSAQIDTKEMTIFFDNLTSNKGFIMILVEDKNEKEVSKLVLPVQNHSSKAIIFLPQGEYSITAFHDLNGNEKLDTNFLGVPTEPYGFTNNVRNLLSKPKMEERLVTLDESKSVTFNLDTYP